MDGAAATAMIGTGLARTMKEETMDGYQLGIVMLAIADMHRHCDHHGKCRQMTPAELDALAD